MRSTAIRSGVDDAGNEIDEPLLVVSGRGCAYIYPHNLWGAEWRGNDLQDRCWHAWATPVEEVVVHAVAARQSPRTGRRRRVRRRQMWDRAEAGVVRRKRVE